MNKHLMQTGRTTRQVQQAIDLSNAGRAVYFMVATRKMVPIIVRRIFDMNAKVGHGIKVEAMPDDFDWDAMKPASAHRANPNCVWIVDHNLAEQHYERLAAQIMRTQILMQQIYPITTGAPIAVNPALASEQFMPPRFNG